MSFERFSSSDVYIFEHVNGFIECCGCLFSDWDDSEPFPQLKTPREALTHLYKHIDAGHDIGKAAVRIIKEYPDLDIKIEPYVVDPEITARVRSAMKLSMQQHPPQEFRDRSNGE